MDQTDIDGIMDVGLTTRKSSRRIGVEEELVERSGNVENKSSNSGCVFRNPITSPTSGVAQNTSDAMDLVAEDDDSRTRKGKGVLMQSCSSTETDFRNKNSVDSFKMVKEVIKPEEPQIDELVGKTLITYKRKPKVKWKRYWGDNVITYKRKKKLLVLDLNGLLVHITEFVPPYYDHGVMLLKKAIFKRPYVDDFLKFCFKKFNVGLWSSRTGRNLKPIVDYLFGDLKHKLLFTWDQQHCCVTRFKSVENWHKPLILKKLKRLWENWGEYNKTNTLLIDDSPCKAVCNPPYTAIFPNSYEYWHDNDNLLGPGGDLRVYLEGLAMAKDVQEYVKQNPFGKSAITERNWRFYTMVIEAYKSPPREQPAEDDDDDS